MNTCVVTASVSRNAGGLFTSVRRLSQSLADLPGVSVRVLSNRDAHTDADLPQWNPLPVQVFPVTGPAQFGYAPQLKKALLRSEADLVHVHGIWMYPSVAVGAWHRKTGRPHVISLRGMMDPWALENSRWKKRLAGWLFENTHLRHAACIHALCQSEAESIRAYGLKNPICIIPNGIDLPILENAEKLQTGNADKGKTEALKSGKAEIGEKGSLEARKSEDADSAISASEHASLSAFQRLSVSPSPPSSLSASQPFSVSDVAASGRKVLLYLGRIHPKKGLVNLLRAWARVARPQSSDFCPPSSDWTLVIAGWDQGGHEAELKQLATELGLRWADVRENAEKLKTEIGKAANAAASASHDLSLSAFQPFSISDFSPQDSTVLFLGPQFDDAKTACYRDCDAFILPSFSEGLPMVVLEAWANGKPVLMTPECNLPEGFAANAAIRIEPTMESIQEGLAALFRLPSSDLCSLGSKGRQLVSARFAWPQIAAEMKAVYDWVLGGGSKPGCIV